jgi:hypothetical protein
VALLRLVGGAPARVDGVKVTFLDAGSIQRQLPLDAAVGAELEAALPMRSFPAYQGQRNFPGLWWSATTGGHVGFESWLERDHAILLDFDPRVVGFSSQPFRLSWPEGSRVRLHTPDFFARLDDGSGVVVDCRPADRIRPRDAVAFAATERACAEVGWAFRLVDAPEPMFMANVRWLAGYRHPRYRLRLLIPRLLEVFATPRPLLDGIREAGDPIAVLPVCYHLLWARQLAADLSVPLEDDSLIWPGEEP